MPVIQPASRYRPSVGKSVLPSTSAPVSLPTPTAYYPFTSNSNDVCINPANFNTYNSTTGLIGNGQLMGTSSILYTSSGGKFNPAGADWTLSFWFKFSAQGTQFLPRVMVSYGSSAVITAPYIYAGYIGGGNERIYYSASGKTTAYVDGTTLLSASTWHLIVARQTSSLLYVSADNGTESSVSQSAITLSSLSHLIIQNTDGTNTVAVDEVAWFNGVALNSTQKTTLYNAGAGHTFNGTSWI